MALDTSLANIVIKNNTIDQGRFSTGSTPVTYNYTHHSWVYGSSIIEGNTFMCPAASSDMLNIDSCSCLVARNRFIRAGTSINSYIRHYGSSDQMITDNIFDGYTTDGTSENIVTGLNVTSIYDRNKNQTRIKQIKIRGHANEQGGNFPNLVDKANVSNAVPIREEPFLVAHGQIYGAPVGESAYEIFTAQTASQASAEKNIKVRYNFVLDQYLPPNVRIMNVMLSFYGNGYMELVSDTNSTFVMKIAQTVTQNVNFASPAGSFADIATSAGLQSGILYTASSNVITTVYPTGYDSATGYLNINLASDDTNTFVTGAGYSNNIYIDLDLHAKANSFTTQFYHAFLVKYKYV